jgi:hypothetical protein
MRKGRRGGEHKEELPERPEELPERRQVEVVWLHMYLGRRHIGRQGRAIAGAGGGLCGLISSQGAMVVRQGGVGPGGSQERVMV